MANFRFLHAADVHLDSPLHGLSRYEGVPLDEIRGATRAALDALINTALEERVDFVVIAGDLFDGDWKDMGTGLYFARAMSVLAKAGVPTFVLAGNHDAASVLTKQLPWPETVRVFGSRATQTFTLDELGVALHGQSFATQHVHDDLAAGYPPPRPGMFNLGVLHTALTGAEGHAPYAPCSVETLRAKGYDYWALGHVHDHQVVAERPPVVFPGNLQGRNIRETGPKGAVLVEVRDREVADLRFVPLDVARWARVRVDCSGMEAREDVHTAVRDAFSKAHSEADGRPVVARVELTGETVLAGGLRDGAAQLRADLQAQAAYVASDLWLEKVVSRLRPPDAGAPAALPDELTALLAEAADDEALVEALAAELKPFALIRPPEEGDRGELDGAAARGDWSVLLQAAVETLPSRFAHGAD